MIIGDATALLVIALLAINLLAFAAFGMDKRRAQRREWRIPERTLLAFALLGGTGGAYLGRSHYRHKSCKRSFSVALHLIALIQIAFIVWFVMRP